MNSLIARGPWEFSLLPNFWEAFVSNLCLCYPFIYIQLYLVPFLWQSLQRGTRSSLSTLPPLEPGADSVGQPMDRNGLLESSYIKIAT